MRWRHPCLERAVGWERRLALPVVVAAVVAVLTLPFHVVGGWHPHGPVGSLLTVTGWVTWMVFSAEVILVTWSHPHPAAWMRRNWMSVTVAAATFPLLTVLLSAMSGTGVLRLFKVGKLLKVAKAGKAAKSAKILYKAAVSVGRSRTAWASVAACALIGLSVLAYAVGAIDRPSLFERRASGGH